MLFRKHRSDATRIEMGSYAADGGITVITSIHADEARRVFGDDTIQALTNLESEEWLDVRLKEKFEFE